MAIFKWTLILPLWLFTFGILNVNAESIPITILHTNDLHSHFRGESTPLGLGGVARIKTAIDQVKGEVPHTLLVDAGDWSEGSVYYFEGAGIESIKMMDRLGYDVAVIGNHDWLNGPDALLNLFRAVSPKTQFVSYNLSTEGYAHESEFRRWVLPYTIKEIAGVKIAFIGLSTFELIYDKYFSPIKITEPFFKTRELAKKLKGSGQADFVVAISHNSILVNKGILKAATDVDLLISGHEHEKLTHPIEVSRLGHQSAWIVETGSWGRFLGRVDLKLEAGKISLDRYRLIQIDSSIPEDSTILKEIENIEARLENQIGPVFHDHIGDSEMEITKSGINNDMGNLMTDSYLKAAQADFAIDSPSFIYGSLHEGPLRTADIISASPSVYNPDLKKSWTVKTLSISGRTLKWFLYLIHTTKKLSSLGILSTSGLSYVYDPIFLQNQFNTAYNLQSQLAQPQMMDAMLMNQITNPSPDSISDSTMESMSLPVVKSIEVQGRPLESNATYTMATSEGFVEAIRFLNKIIVKAIPLNDLRDSGKEAWRALLDHVQEVSPIHEGKVPREHRIQTLQPDLGIYADDVQWMPIRKTSEGMLAQIQVRVRNYGALDTTEISDYNDHPVQVHLLVNVNGSNQTIEPQLIELESAKTVGSLKAGHSATLSWEVNIPEAMGLYPITVRVDGDPSEINLSNNEVTRWFVEK